MSGMVERILVPLDRSDVSESIIPLALALAKATGAKLYVGYVLPRPSERTVDRDAAEYRAAIRYLSEWTQRIKAQSIDTHGEVIHGEPADEIIAYALRYKVDLIMMETHGRRAVTRIITGSVTDDVIRRSPVPVLSQRMAEGGEPAPARPPQRILVPLDGSPIAEMILPTAAGLARQLGGRLHLLRVIDFDDVEDLNPMLAAPTYDQEHAARLVAAEFDKARHYLDHFQPHYARHGVEITTEVQFGKPTTTILTVAEDFKADLIAISTHGRSGLRRAVLGSVTTALLTRSTIPLLTVSAAALEAAPDEVRQFLGARGS